MFGFKGGSFTFRLRVMGDEDGLKKAQETIEAKYGENTVENSGGSLRVTIQQDGWRRTDEDCFGELYREGLIQSFERHVVSGNPADTNMIPEGYVWCGLCVGYYLPHDHKEE
jgi:hypothetical protein